MNAHRRQRSSAAGRLLLRAGLLVSAAGAAVGGAGTAAAAAEGETAAESLAGTGEGLTAAATQSLGALDDATTYALGPVFGLQLDPLARTGSDPLDNGVGTKITGFPAVGTQDLTGPLADGASLGDLPLTGAVADAVTG
ncbi:hypothetical protein [Streptomyces sulphureus]|uniref:hypothetical protein n=1 Tax=Streptomyces sulphureus TaxID=47758 RepID=UPI00035EF8CC|nr:hypothetical protein [Streptomyces sulphureus]